jgi:hypothetical protein
MFLDAIQPPQEIKMPPRATEFAIGNGLQADLFLFLDGTLDLSVLDFLQLRGSNFAGDTVFARFLECGGPQQAADMIGAVGRLTAL